MTILDTVPQHPALTGKYTANCSRVTSTEQSHPPAESTQGPSKRTGHAGSMNLLGFDGQPQTFCRKNLPSGSCTAQAYGVIRHLGAPYTRFSLFPASWKVTRDPSRQYRKGRGNGRAGLTEGEQRCKWARGSVEPVFASGQGQAQESGARGLPWVRIL